MSENEKQFDKLLLSLNFIENYDSGTILQYKKEEIKFIYYINYNRNDSEIEIKSHPITIQGNPSRYSSSTKWSFDDGIECIKHMFSKELRLLKISKLLNENK